MAACRYDGPEHSSAQGHPTAYADGTPSKLTITSMRLRRMGGYAAQIHGTGPAGPFYVRLRGHRPYGPNLSLEVLEWTFSWPILMAPPSQYIIM